MTLFLMTTTTKQKSPLITERGFRGEVFFVAKQLNMAEKAQKEFFPLENARNLHKQIEFLYVVTAIYGNKKRHSANTPTDAGCAEMQTVIC